MNYNNLHSHTTNSDGEITVSEAMDFCQKNDVSVVAFTDHDTLLSEEDVKYLKAYNGDVKWVSGVELSIGSLSDINEEISSFHMVGLFVDPFDKDLREFCQKAQQGRKDRMVKMIQNLKNIDIYITEEDCFKASGGETVGRPHIIKAIMKYEKNNTVMEELFQKMKGECGENEIAKMQLNRIKQRGEKQKPYSIFLAKDAYIPNIYVDYQFKPSFDQCSEVIRGAGGLSFLAHYYTCAHKLPLSILEKVLKEDRLDGIEIVYGSDIYYSSDEESIKMLDNQRESLLEISKRTNCLLSGGGDTHTLSEWEAFVNNKGYAQKTVGLFDGILKNRKKELNWYSL